MTLTDGEIDACLDAALTLASWACARMTAGPSGVTTKDGAADWVTAVDLEIEREVRSRLATLFPGHMVRGEEYGESGPERPEGPDGSEGSNGDVVWYVDPIDGTTNFVHGLPWSSFSLAVADSAGTAAGVVADPWRGEIFSAARGRGARLNGAATACSSAMSLAGGIVLTELTGTLVYPGLPELMASLSRQGCVTRIMGSSALSLASVAAGRCLGTVVDGFQPWDVMAGALVAAESGAEVFIDSGPYRLIALAPGVARAALEAWTT